MITYSNTNDLIAAAQARSIFVGNRSLRDDVAVELSRLLGEQITCAFTAGTVGSKAFTETSAQKTARTTKDAAFAAADPNRTKPYDRR